MAKDKIRAKGANIFCNGGSATEKLNVACVGVGGRGFSRRMGGFVGRMRGMSE